MKYFLMVCTLLGWSVLGQAQRIILDLPTKAGELTLFPEVNKENNYYYVADKAQLAMDKDGRPKFSFLRYVENQKSEGGSQSITRGEGGGILHAVVSLAVSEEQLQEAERALKRINPEGTIIGPVIYKSGTFGLVTSFTDDNGELAKAVAGVGQAPILDGQQAAVSIHLTRLGATLLWSSFQTATPDISFSFNMTMDGYRLPKEAIIEANFEDIYESMEIGLQAGIGGTVSGGAGAGASAGSGASGGANAGRNGANSGAANTNNNGSSTTNNNASNSNASSNSETENPTQEQPGTEPTESSTSTGETESSTESPTESGTSNESSESTGNNTSNESDAGPQEPLARSAPSPPNGGNNGGNNGGGGAGASAQGEVPFYFGADLRWQFEKLRKSGAIKITQIGSDEGMDQLINTAYSKLADMMFERVESNGRQGQGPSAMLGAMNQAAGGNNQRSSPVSGITFSYKMKKKRRTGTFRMDLNKWTTDELVMRFDENIGNLSRYLSDTRHFHRVNTDDPLYRQREVYAIVDGYNAANFGDYINFVTVRMKKTHANGEITHDEVKIDRKNFNQNGNVFNMVYGWKGDDNRDKWMEYEHEVLWSFFGDVEVTEPLEKSNFNAINLAPPYAKREVEFQADPTFLADQEVRLVNVKLYYTMGEKEFFKAISLNPSRNQLSEKIVFVAPVDVGDYEYEVTWRLRGNRVVSSGRLRAEDNVLFVDELPEVPTDE